MKTKSSLQDLFDSWGKDTFIASTDTERERKKLGSIEATFKDDPLALACGAYRMWKRSPHVRWSDFEIVIVDREDRYMAEDIRKYYNARYTMQALAGRPLTEYQHKAASFLTGVRNLKVDEIGMLYRLPYFYVEDSALDRIVAQTQSQQQWVMNKDMIITPLEEVLKSRRAVDTYQFWFKTQNNHAVSLELQAHNPVLTMVRGLHKKSEICVRSMINSENLSGPHKNFYYGRLFNLELIF